MSNPSVKGRPCAICGSMRPCVTYSHHDHAGFGGDPTKARADGMPACGDGTDAGGPNCHGQISGKRIETTRCALTGLSAYRCDWRGAQYLRSRPAFRHTAVVEGVWQVARFEFADIDLMEETA